MVEGRTTTSIRHGQTVHFFIRLDKRNQHTRYVHKKGYRNYQQEPLLQTVASPGTGQTITICIVNSTFYLEQTGCTIKTGIDRCFTTNYNTTPVAWLRIGRSRSEYDGLSRRTLCDNFWTTGNHERQTSEPLKDPLTVVPASTVMVWFSTIYTNPLRI